MGARIAISSRPALHPAAAPASRGGPLSRPLPETGRGAYARAFRLSTGRCPKREEGPMLGRFAYPPASPRNGKKGLCSGVSPLHRPLPKTGRGAYARAFRLSTGLSPKREEGPMLGRFVYPPAAARNGKKGLCSGVSPIHWPLPKTGRGACTGARCLVHLASPERRGSSRLRGGFSFVLRPPSSVRAYNNTRQHVGSAAARAARAAKDET